MPVISRGTQRIDYLDEGAGATVVLIHSSVSGNRQWRSFIDSLKDHYRVIAPNLFGYGETTAWAGMVPQTLEAQAELILAICENVEGPVHMVGHSFGGAVAVKAASLLASRAGKLVLFEPMLGYLLPHHGRHDAYREATELADHVRHFVARGDLSTAAGKFADYWMGDGSWAEMPEKRRSAFATALQASVYEFEAMLGESSDIDLCNSLPAATMVMHGTDPRPPIREVMEILEGACPHWTFKQMANVGHMAPLTHPEVINPVIREFFNID